jgi:transcriptional regulator of acetoin/glycerol metabolism
MLPAELLAGRTRRLSSIEAFEHGEIVRVLASGKVTMSQAARQLGMSRATLYRKTAYYKIDPRNPG